MTKTLARVSELPPNLRRGREEGFVSIEDVPEPSDNEKLALMRERIAEGARAAAEGRVSPAEEVFARLRRALSQNQ